MERLACMTEAEPGIWLTGTTMEQMKEMGKPEEGRSPVKPKEWRVEAQPQTQKSVTEAERRPTDRLSGCTREPIGVLGQMGLSGDASCGNAYEGMQCQSGVGGLPERSRRAAKLRWRHGPGGAKCSRGLLQYRAGGGEA